MQTLGKFSEQQGFVWYETVVPFSSVYMAQSFMCRAEAAGVTNLELRVFGDVVLVVGKTHEPR